MSLPTRRRVGVLVEVRVDLDRAGVQAGLVREGATHRRTAAGSSGGTLVTSATACAIRVASASRPSGSSDLAALELEVRDHREQVGVAGPLAVPVDRALHVRRRRRRPRPACWRPRSRCRCGSGCRPGRRCSAARRWTTSGELARQHPAVGVAQRDHLGAGLRGGPHHLERVVAVQRVAVEEVLGVQEHPLSLVPQVPTVSRDHRQVLRQAWCAAPARRAGVALRDQRHHRRAGLAQRRHQRVVGGRRTRPAGSPRTRRRSRSSAAARSWPGGRTRCPWGWPPASRPRCSPRPGRPGAARSPACPGPRG